MAYRPGTAKKALEHMAGRKPAPMSAEHKALRRMQARRDRKPPPINPLWAEFQRREGYTDYEIKKALAEYEAKRIAWRPRPKQSTAYYVKKGR